MAETQPHIWQTLDSNDPYMVWGDRVNNGALKGGLRHEIDIMYDPEFSGPFSFRYYYPTTGAEEIIREPYDHPKRFSSKQEAIEEASNFRRHIDAGGKPEDYGARNNYKQPWPIGGMNKVEFDYRSEEYLDKGWRQIIVNGPGSTRGQYSINDFTVPGYKPTAVRQNVGEEYFTPGNNHQISTRVLNINGVPGYSFVYYAPEYEHDLEHDADLWSYQHPVAYPNNEQAVAAADQFINYIKSGGHKDKFTESTYQSSPWSISAMNKVDDENWLGRPSDAFIKRYSIGSSNYHIKIVPIRYLDNLTGKNVESWSWSNHALNNGNPINRHYTTHKTAKDAMVSADAFIQHVKSGKPISDFRDPGTYDKPWSISNMNKDEDKFDEKELAAGSEEELEHTNNPKEAAKIAKDHLREDPKYYSKLKAAGLMKASMNKTEDQWFGLVSPFFVFRHPGYLKTPIFDSDGQPILIRPEDDVHIVKVNPVGTDSFSLNYNTPEFHSAVRQADRDKYSYRHPEVYSSMEQAKSAANAFVDHIKSGKNRKDFRFTNYFNQPWSISSMNKAESNFQDSGWGLSNSLPIRSASPYEHFFRYISDPNVSHTISVLNFANKLDDQAWAVYYNGYNNKGDLIHKFSTPTLHPSRDLAFQVGERLARHILSGGDPKTFKEESQFNQPWAISNMNKAEWSNPYGGVTYIRLPNRDMIAILSESANKHYVVHYKPTVVPDKLYGGDKEEMNIEPLKYDGNIQRRKDFNDINSAKVWAEDYVNRLNAPTFNQPWSIQNMNKAEWKDYPSMGSSSMLLDLPATKAAHPWSIQAMNGEGQATPRQYRIDVLPAGNVIPGHSGGSDQYIVRVDGHEKYGVVDMLFPVTSPHIAKMYGDLMAEHLKAGKPIEEFKPAGIPLPPDHYYSSIDDKNGFRPGQNFRPVTKDELSMPQPKTTPKKFNDPHPIGTQMDPPDAVSSQTVGRIKTQGMDPSTKAPLPPKNSMVTAGKVMSPKSGRTVSSREPNQE